MTAIAAATGLDARAAALLDTTTVGAHLQAALPAARGARLVGTHLHQSRRRISRKTAAHAAPWFDLTYALDLQCGDGAHRTLWCHLQACSGGLAGRLADDGGRAAGAIHLPALDALLWPLAADPALTQLGDFLDGTQVQAAVARGCDGTAVGPVPAAATLVRYEARTHAVARIELPQPGRPRAVWGKAYAGEQWRAVAQRLLLLWPCGEQQRAAFAVARPVGASAALRSVWQDEVDGAPARAALATACATSLLDRVAESLARLQALPLLSSTSLAPTVLLERATKQAHKLTLATPAWGEALQALLKHLASTCPAAGAPCNVHGDFHVDQLRVAEDRLVLFDFDEFAVGDPAHDVADFASQLLTDATLPDALRRRLARHFVAAAPRAATPASLDWHLRVLLLRKAYSFFVRHRAGWRDATWHALGLAALGAECLQPAGLEHAA